MTDSLSSMQRRILSAMQNDEVGLAAFVGEKSRKLGFGILAAKHGGIIIRAYQSPEYFLKNRGLIERQERNAPGCWYRLTDAGRAALSKAGEQHPKNKRCPTCGEPVASIFDHVDIDCEHP